jgi:predicted nucleotidyltransferase
MKLTDVLSTLKEAEPALRPHGILHAAVFGSVARGEERSDSDIDIALDLDPEVSRTLWDYARAQRVVGELFPGPVDVVERDALRPNVRERVERELVYAF